MRKLAGGTIRITQQRADGTRNHIEVEVREGDTISIEREYADGHTEERQLYPQASGGYKPKRGPWKSEENKS